MFHTRLSESSRWFEVLHTTDLSQTAVMNLDPGQSSGEDEESHPESDQILLVIEGQVLGQVADEQARLIAGDVVVIPAGVTHRFENTGPERARTFSVYAPPAYPSGTKE